MSVFPSGLDIFVDRTGADAIASSDPNNAYDAIEAIEAFLGASGAPQAQSVNFINLFRAMFNPMPACSWIDADTIGILPTQAVLYATDNFVIKRNTAVLTVPLSLSIDVGSEQASSWYDLYLVGDGVNSQYTAKFVLQGSTPSGLTYYKKINSFRNDSGSNLLRAFQYDKLMMWDTPIIVSTTRSEEAWSGAVSCTMAMPSISTLAKFILYMEEATAGEPTLLAIRPNGSIGSSDSRSNFYFEDDNAADPAKQMLTTQWECMTDSLQQIQLWSHASNGFIRISVQGYYVNI